MKTSVNMVRKMGDFDVTQRTKDGMFNANGLAKQWNQSSGQRKDVSDFLRLSSTSEMIEALKTDTSIPVSTDKEIVVKKRGGKVQGTWMHPYLFIDFAMWLNPSFKVQVITFIYDQLIKYRNDSGDMYVGLSSSIKRLKGVDYGKVGRGLNYIVFNEHKKGRRNYATELELKELYELEKQLAFMIDNGLIDNFDSLLLTMRIIYDKKYNKFKV